MPAGFGQSTTASGASRTNKPVNRSLVTDQSGRGAERAQLAALKPIVTGQDAYVVTPGDAQHLWVLLVGMLIVGLATRALDEALDVKNNLGGPVPRLSILVIVKQEMDAASFLAAAPSFIISWVLGAHLIFERNHPKQPTNERRGAPPRQAQVFL